MPTNKNAQLRYEVLDRCFWNFNRKYAIDDLLAIVNDALDKHNGSPIQMRQLRMDIKDMKEKGTPIKAYPWQGKVHCYLYEDPQSEPNLFFFTRPFLVDTSVKI